MTEFRENKDVRRPFLSTPTPSVYFPGSTIEKARRATSRCLRRDEGVALVVGSTGVGKTLLARVLASEFDADALVAFVSPRRRLDVKSFFQQFLFGLRQTFCGCDETELRLMALDYLERASQERCVLLVDDAQNLTLRVFDEIRGLIDQCAASTIRLSVALFGLGSLEERLNLPALFPFQQRVVSRAYLENFSRAEIAKYVERELKRADVAARFSKGAIEQIARLSDGSPRVVNQLCDRALFLAFVGEDNESIDESDSLKRRRTERVEIDQKDVERAWARLQSLPEDEEEVSEVQNCGVEGSVTESVVEFGLLDDDETDEYNKGNVAQPQQEPKETGESASETTVLNETSEEGVISQDESDLNDALEERAEETAEETIEETTENAEASVVVPKPFDWEADRYGSLEESASPASVEADEAVPAFVEETSNEAAEPEIMLETGDESGVATSENVEVVESDSNFSSGPSCGLAQDERRIRAKKAFWGEESNEDVDEEVNKASSSAAVENERNEQIEESEEEGEEGESSGEIDYELDARLREKFGASIVSETSATSEATDEESNEELLPPELDVDGMRFEPRGGAEFVEPTEASKSIVKRARKALQPRSYLSAKLSARSIHTPQESSDVAPDDATASESFDASLELTAESVATTTPKSTTRRPIEKDDDGSREYREVNGFDAEDGARLAADDRFLESQFAAFPQDSPLRSWGASDGSGESDDAEAPTPDERAYRQIVASCYRSAADFPSSAQYLNELQLLEQEIAEEANLIRRIRNIHLRLRSVCSPGSADHIADAGLSEPTSAFVAK